MKPGKYDLTSGGILQKLLLVALPVMGSSFMQMAYNLTDMFWLGRVSGNAIAASGTVGMYMWLSMALIIFGRVGAEIGVSQNIGRGDRETARDFAQSAVMVALILGTAYAAVMVVFQKPLIGFYNIQEAAVVADARLYLSIISAGIPFAFVSSSVNGAFNGSGNSRVPFFINTTGLVINMVLDPLLIFTAGWGIAGAALATVFAQAVVCALFLLNITRGKARPFERFRPFIRLCRDRLRQILRWGWPIALESALFTLLSMLISRLVASFGSEVLAAQRVGGQIESMAWLIAGGYSTALIAFVGQNFGGQKWERIRRGYRLSVISMAAWGVAVTATLFFGAQPLMRVFLPGEAQAVAAGVGYLRILAISQVCTCVEMTVSGGFKGFGKTLPPSVVSITCNALRVPLAYYLASTSLGLSGVWWAITIGALGRGIWGFLWYALRSPVKQAEREALARAAEQARTQEA